RRLNHVVLDVRPEPMLRAEDSRESGSRMRREPVRDVPQVAVHRRRVADHADAFAVESVRLEETLGPKAHAHRAIIEPGLKRRRAYRLWAVACHRPALDRL